MEEWTASIKTDLFTHHLLIKLTNSLKNNKYIRLIRERKNPIK